MTYNYFDGPDLPHFRVVNAIVFVDKQKSYQVNNLPEYQLQS